MPSSPQIGGECNSIQSGWLYFGYETEILFWNLFYLPFYISQFFVFNEHVKWSRGVGGASGKKKKPAYQCRRLRRRMFDHWVGKIPLEEEMATHSNILAWRIPWTQEPGGLQSQGWKEWDTIEVT